MMGRMLLRSPVATLAATGAFCTVRASLCDPDSTAALQRARVTGINEVAATRWLRLSTIDYEDPSGKLRKWDMATRTTRKPGTEVDAVAILALLRRRAEPNAPEMLLVEQFRPPMNAVTVELPAGLIDPGESPETAALRELKEETGYVGVNAYTSGKLALSPGLTDESVQLCVVEVDLDDPANRTVPAIERACACCTEAH